MIMRYCLPIRVEGCSPELQEEDLVVKVIHKSNWLEDSQWTLVSFWWSCQSLTKSAPWLLICTLLPTLLCRPALCLDSTKVQNRIFVLAQAAMTRCPAKCFRKKPSSDFSPTGTLPLVPLPWEVTPWHTHSRVRWKLLNFTTQISLSRAECKYSAVFGTLFASSLKEMWPVVLPWLWCHKEQAVDSWLGADVGGICKPHWYCFLKIKVLLEFFLTVLLCCL